MKTAEELYPECAEKKRKYGYWSGPSDYSPIIAEFGSILLRVDDDDYQGDSRVLYEQGGKIGYLQFGWGSCSGCDALQGCSSMDEVQKLMDELRDQVKWFDSKADALRWFQAHDWKGDYSWHDEQQKRFVSEAIALLSGEPSKE
jgi:hypothetical protein